MKVASQRVSIDFVGIGGLFNAKEMGRQDSFP